MYEKRFRRGHKFMKVVREGSETTYRISWEDVRILLCCPVIISLNIKQKSAYFICKCRCFFVILQWI